MSRLTRTAAPAVLMAALALVLAGCAASTATPEASSTPACEVHVVVNFGVLDAKPIKKCVAAGPATDVLAAAKITLKGTDDYGDQVICRVNNEPSPKETVTIKGTAPFVESCKTLNAAAYWALWVKSSATGAWEYAQEGATTLKLTSGQSLGLVYTPGADSTPPQD
ncbi:hypothetical protein BH09ACT6_BH09ACT6_17950 [soil metagenome]